MRALRTLLLSTAASATLLANVNASADTPLAITYVPNSLTEAAIADGPWSLHQMGRYPHDTSGVVPPISTPYNPPTTAYGTPYHDYCVGGRVQRADGVNPMQPYYFPFVRSNGEYLEGFFDYRPRNEQEATVAAISFDWGKRWIFAGEALGLSPYCPADQTDPDNNNVIVDGLSTPYASNPDNAADNGLGHAFVMTVDGDQLLYQLNRANGHIDSDPLVVHRLKSKRADRLAFLPRWGYVSPLASRGYPTLEASAKATVGLQSPDAILGAVQTGGVTTIVYVEKQLGGAPGTPVLTRRKPARARQAGRSPISTPASRGRRTTISSRSASPRRRMASISPMSVPRAACRTRTASSLMPSVGLAAAASSHFRTVATACSLAQATASTTIPTDTTSSAMPRQ
jgi:hypothetical protein